MKGQSLIEVLVALGILSVVILYIATIVTGSVNSAKFASDKNAADGYASEGIEIMRTIRDQNPTSFKVFSGTYCLNKNSTSLVSSPTNCSTENVDTFIRQVQIEQTPGCGTNLAKVNVKVFWSDGKCSTSNKYCHVANLETCLSTVTSVAAP